MGRLHEADDLVLATLHCVAGVALARGQSSTLVTWSDCGRVVANILASDGSVGNAVTVRQTDDTGSLSAAWNGNEWLVVWEDFADGTDSDGSLIYDRRIYASRLSASLIALGSPIVLTSFGTAPLAASDGDGFLVVWSRYQDDARHQGEVTVPYSSVIAQRISSDGSSPGQDNGAPLTPGNAKSLVWDGVQYDLAFSSYFYVGNQPYPSPYTLHVTPVAATGPFVSLVPQSVVTNDFDPSATFVRRRPAPHDRRLLAPRLRAAVRRRRARVCEHSLRIAGTGFGAALKGESFPGRCHEMAPTG